MDSLFRYAAFTDRPEGGNPAGVWIGDRLPAPDIMQRIAAEVGFAETACVACGRPHAHVLAGVSGPWEPATVNGSLLQRGRRAAIGYPGVVLDECDGKGQTA